MGNNTALFISFALLFCFITYHVFFFFFCRSESNQVQLPRYRLKFTCEVNDEIEKGKIIETKNHGKNISVVLYDGDNQIAETEPLSSATVMLVVVNGEFNQHGNQYNWSRKDFERNIRRPRQGSSATGDVKQIAESIVSECVFKLDGGVKSHSDATILDNSSNKKVRLGVMVLSQTEERVLEGLSNPFFVRGHDRKAKGNNLGHNRLKKRTMQSGPNSGVHIQPVEPDDHDEKRSPKRTLHNKYRLRFVNKECKSYYTWEMLKADDGNPLKVALYDENNTKITSGPLSSASLEVVVLHGDFNANGQDDWTREEFNSSVVSPQNQNGAPVLVGDRTLALLDGEAILADARFYKASVEATNVKLGVMLIGTEERIQEGITEPFFVRICREEGPLKCQDRLDNGILRCLLSKCTITSYEGPCPAIIIYDDDEGWIYRFNPWSLPPVQNASVQQQEWYFWCPSKLAIVDHAIGPGYWKNTGHETNILLPLSADFRIEGVKKVHVFTKDNMAIVQESKTTFGLDRIIWIMHEYSIAQHVPIPTPNKMIFNWVLCRICKKKCPERGVPDSRKELNLLDSIAPTSVAKTLDPSTQKAKIMSCTPGIPTLAIGM